MGWYRRAVLASRCVFVVIGVALLVVTAANGGGVVGFVIGGALRRARRRAVPARAEAHAMARKVRGFERVLDAPALFAVAYGEIGASIYFALGIVAAQALGLTPVVLLLTGRPVPRRLALLRGGHGGDPGDRRRRDLHAPGVQRPRRGSHGLGALPRLPDRDRALRAVPAALPRRGPRRADALRDSPWDVVVAVAVIVGDRRRPARPAHATSTAWRSCVALLDLVVQVVLVDPRASRSSSRRTRWRRASTSPPGRAGATISRFALPLAMLAYTGLETVANLAEETREPGRALPRSLFSAIGLVVVLTVLIAIVGAHRLPGRGRVDGARGRVAARRRSSAS